MFFTNKNDDLEYVREKVKKYIARYYHRHKKIIQINPKFDDVDVFKCPTCRKEIDNSSYKRVYVNTICVCCFKEVTQTILLSCDHANICFACFIIMQIKDDVPYFIFDTGEPVRTSKRQIDVIEAYKTFYNGVNRNWSKLLL